MTGRLLDERLGRWSFWVSFVGFNLAFFPMHIAELMGMPRRIYTYDSGLGWTGPNLVTSIGAFIFAAGVLLTLANVVRSRTRGERAGPNPWDAATLEWSTASPPPAYNFARIPVVASRHPLWEDRLDEGSARSVLDSDIVLDDGRETIATTPLDAQADAILVMPGDSIVPVLCALATALVFFALLWHAWWLAGLGALLTTFSGLAWLTPVPLAQEVGND